MSADGGNPKVVEMKARGRGAAAGRLPRPLAPQPRPSSAEAALAGVTSSWAIVPVILLARRRVVSWLTGGRYASTDNAYVQQDRVTITADVSGPDRRGRGRENQHVKRATSSSGIDPEPYKIALAGAEAALASARLQVEQLRATYQQALAEEQTAHRRSRLQAEGLRPPAGPAEEGRRVAGDLRPGRERRSTTAQQALTQATEKASSRHVAALGGDPPSRPTLHPAVLAAHRQARPGRARPREHRGAGARSTASSRRPTGFRSAAT